MRVLCDEMANPISVQGCIAAGMMPVLARYIASDPDDLTRERASNALSISARDANGRFAMLKYETAEQVSPALHDSNVVVRRNVLQSFVNFSGGGTSFEAVRNLIAAKYPSLLVEKAPQEVPDVQPLVLRLIYICIKDESGLQDSLKSGAVSICIGLLSSSHAEVRKEAARTLSFLCFAEMAKPMALEGGALPALTQLLSDEVTEVRAAAAGALTAITTTDEAKRQIVRTGSVEPIISLLADPDRLVKLNVLKAIANFSVNPAAREILKRSDTVLPTLFRLEKGDDPLLSKHAKIAKSAVLWEP